MAKQAIKQNPFAGFGGIVPESKFIGRKKEILKIRSRVLGNENNYGNIAIVGIPRIGKTSLAWNAVISLKENLIKEKTVAAYISTGTMLSSHDLFKAMASMIVEEIEDSGFFEDLSYKFNTFLNKIKSSTNDYDFKSSVQRFFKILKKEGFKALFVLDEFDSAATLLKTSDFQLLRELSYNPETKICIVTVSRLTIQEIEPEYGSISNFFGIFSDLNLTLFSKEDMGFYWKRVEDLGFNVENEYKKKVEYLVGRHPFLLDMVNNFIFDKTITSNISQTEALSHIDDELKKSLWDHYETFISLLEKEDLKHQFLQTVVGPTVEICPIKIERLLKYDVIHAVSAGNKYGESLDYLTESKIIDPNNDYYTSFSEHFMDYLKMKEKTFNIWPLWSETEILIRKLIKKYLQEKYGSNWQDSFLKENPKQRTLIEEMQDRAVKNRKTFGNLASEHLVDYSYPLQMWDCFILSDKNSSFFGNIFLDKTSWKEKFSLLSKVRNPIAHSNQNFVSKDDISRAKMICEDILNKISDL